MSRAGADYDRYDEVRDHRRRPGNPAAVAALVLGLLSFCLLFLTGIPAIVCGAIGIGKSGPRGTKRGMAIAGLILGVFGTVVLPLMSLIVLPALLLPAVQKVREAAARSTAMNNLKQQMIAMHNHASALNDDFPAHAVYDKDGRTALLSWRVAILPFLDADGPALHKRFRLDEPWDSANNKALIPLMPKVYASPNFPPADPGLTHFQVIVGPKTAFPPRPKGSNLQKSFVDGTANTLAVVQGRDAVVWTKPDDIPFDADDLPARLGDSKAAAALVAMADGSVRAVPRVISDKTLRAAVTPAGGEVLGADWNNP